MSDSGHTSLLAICLPSTAAAPAIRRAWQAGEAVMVINAGAPAAERQRLLDTLRPTEILDAQGRRAVPGGVPVESGIAAVVTTSGTTGAPRGVELTRVGLHAMGHAVSEALEVGPDDRWLACLPFHHVAGLAILARAMVTGVPVTVHDGFDLDAVATSATREGTTIASLVPTMLHRLLDADAPMHTYRKLVLGGAPMPAALAARAATAGAPVVTTYGLSETWGGCVLDGRAIHGLELRVDDRGEVLLRGPMLMRGYRLAPEDTARAFDAGGWFHTGDLGTLAADGTLAIVDRLRDLVITGGVNVSPTEVENVLAGHRSIADVCVIGVPDDEWGERVVACVVPVDASEPPTVDELRAFARNQLAAPKLPRELRLVSEIPRSPGGKILRRALR